MSEAWDTHLHLFDPERFPFKAHRRYTPSSASVPSLLATTQASNFLIMQATVEDGCDGILSQIQELKHRRPRSKCFAAIIYDLEEDWTHQQLLSLHASGVRGLRYHITFAGQQIEDAYKNVHRLLRGRLASIARTYGWVLSLSLPLAVWAKLASTITQSNLNGLTIIAEHMGNLRLPFSEEDAHHFESFLDLLRKRTIFVKLGALHRRLQGGAEDELRAAVRAIADAGPKQLLWGSDWPHVDANADPAKPASPLPVDERAELEMLRQCLTDAVFEDMLVSTPNRLFAGNSAASDGLAPQRLPG